MDLLDARSLPEARQVLRLLACFADAPIPYQLLLHPITLAASPPLRDITGSRLWQALKVLDDFGLVDMDTSGQSPAPIPTGRLHPLVRDTSRSAAGPEGLVFLELASRLLERAAAVEEIGAPEDPPTWPTWQLLAPHCVAVFESLTSEPGYSENAAAAITYALYMAARYYAERGFHAAAAAEFREVLAVQLRMLGPEHPDTLSTRFYIAVVMGDLGDHAAAEAEFREVLAVQRVLDPNHPNTLITQYCVAMQMGEQGNHAAAEAEFREVLAAERRVLDPDDPDMLITRNRIALEMASQGKYAAAEAEFREVLAAQLQMLGSDHPNTLATHHNLALLIFQQGNHASAEAEFREILAAGLSVLGPEHPDTMSTRFSLAVVMVQQGKHTAAEAEFREVLAFRRRVLGPEHPDTLLVSRQLDYLALRKNA